MTTIAKAMHLVSLLILMVSMPASALTTSIMTNDLNVSIITDVTHPNHSYGSLFVEVLESCLCH